MTFISFAAAEGAANDLYFTCSGSRLCKWPSSHVQRLRALQMTIISFATAQGATNDLYFICSGTRRCKWPSFHLQRLWALQMTFISFAAAQGTANDLYFICSSSERCKWPFSKTGHGGCKPTVSGHVGECWAEAEGAAAAASLVWNMPSWDFWCSQVFCCCHSWALRKLNNGLRANSPAWPTTRMAYTAHLPRLFVFSKTWIDSSKKGRKHKYLIRFGQS